MIYLFVFFFFFYPLLTLRLILTDNIAFFRPTFFEIMAVILSPLFLQNLFYRFKKTMNSRDRRLVDNLEGGKFGN